jgi:hypothetical protein
VCDTKHGSWFNGWLRFRRDNTMQCATIFRVGNCTAFNLPDALFIYTFIQDVQRHLAVYSSINPKHTAIFSFLSNPQHLLILWPLVPQVRGFAPGRSRRIFRVKKILSTPSFGGEVKPSVQCRSFTACKRFLNVTCNSAFRQNYRIFLAHSCAFRRWALSCGDMRGDAWRWKLELLTKIAQ